MRPDQDFVLEKFYREYFHAVEIHAYRYIGNWDDAHVATQEAFHIACEKIDDFMIQPNKVGWLKNVVKNVCRNMYRAKKKQLSLFISIEDLDRSQEPATFDHVERDPLEDYKELISESEFLLLRKIIIEGVSYAQVANELGISMWACRKRVERALSIIRKKHIEMSNKA